ncbi:MAG: hypothetical protein M9885_08920 [Burkholderiaceae bacterium]|nr:hypothetical protein [Burkholderiaceae bacterium]
MSSITHGPEIIARSMTSATRGSGSGYAHGNLWQYHPRSDRHSKIACWSIFFDLMVRNGLIAHHVRAGKVSFGINHEMRDFRHDRRKDLDLVVCKRSEPRTVASIRSFADMADAYLIALDDEQAAMLGALPPIPLTGVQTALLAIEAKAAMTEFGKARPRLYDELNSSHLTIHGDTDSTIAAGFAMVNRAETFVSPLRNPWNVGANPAVVTKHNQPRDASSVVEKLAQLPRRSSTGDTGFDAFGIIVVRCANDGGPVELLEDRPAPQRGEVLHYDSFLERIETLYESRFSGIR